MSKFWNKTKNYFMQTDGIFWLISISISIFSLLLLLSVSRTSNFGYFRTQLIAIIIGYIGAFVITKSDYRIIAKHYIIVATVCILLIVCTLIFGTSVTGNSGIDAKAWLKLPGGISFQPSELAKIGFMITFSKHLSVLKEKNELKSFLNVALLGVHALVPIALNTGFQQIQGKISIGSGKIFGQGLFNGPRVGSNSVPIQESDFIFSVAGEELGFIGCILVILLLCLMLFRTLKIASLSSDCLGTCICFGFFGLVASQTIFNLGMCLSVLPVMGVTLPFFSAGGSSSACLYFGLGLIQSVFMQRHDDDINAIISE